ncbi:MAG: hypothetical protein KDC57_22625 [Saprospiraceae bacterium]|nr:hypothetical protein [Saprospiraceae bacterium]
MSTNKPRVIKEFEKLDEDTQQQIKLAYPNGFAGHLVYYTNKDGLKVSALPFETDDRYYLVKMTLAQAKEIVREDEDYDDRGNLKSSAKEEYTEKYSDLDHMADYVADDSSSADDDDDDDGMDDLGMGDDQDDDMED